MTKHFAIIGGGAGGLCAAKYLTAQGIEVTIFEAGSRIGGLWVYNNDSGMSPAYKSLHINSEAKVSSFIDFPFEEGAPLYPDHREMSRYFERYAEHSDRGSQYCSYDYQKKLQAYGLRPSMSGKGNCYDNASVETFFKSLKAELIWRQKWPTRRQAEAAIFQYINGFYNTRRRHSYLGGISPLAFEAKVA
jgi:monoamine oxidase